VLSVLLIILIFNNLDGVALGLLLQDIKGDLHLTDTELGTLSGIAFALFYSVMGIPIARWADRGNRVMIVSLAIGLWSLLVALCGVARTFGQLLLIRIAVGVGEAGCIPPSNSLIADYFSREERPRAMSIYLLGGPLSMVIGYLGVSNPPLAVALMAEDSAVEWLQVGLLAGTGVLAACQGWSARRTGEPVAFEVMIVATMVMACLGEIDLDRKLFGIKVVATRFFVNPKYSLAVRALAVLVIVGAPAAVGVWLLRRWRQVLRASLKALREPWGQTAAVGATIYVITQIFEGPIDRIPWQQHHMIEELLELLAAVCMSVGLAARPGLGIRLLRALGRPGFIEDRPVKPR